MAAHTFSRSEALRYGWETTKRNLGLSLGLAVVSLFVVFFVSTVTQSLQQRGSPLAFLFLLLEVLARAFIGVTWIRLALRMHDGQSVSPREVLPDGRSYMSYLAVALLLGLLVTLGLVAFIVPGIYLAVRYGFAPYLVADHRADVIGAFRRSSELTEGARWDLFLLGLVLVALNVAGALLFGIGLIVTIPLSVYTVAHVYRFLEQRAGERLSTYEPIVTPA